MAHFAKLDRHNKVIAVHTLNNEVITDSDGNEQEQLGIDFLTDLYGGTDWYKQTSYNGTFRKAYAGVGFTYDGKLDAFIPKKPHVSWVFNSTACNWKAPVDAPDDGTYYVWNEYNLNWENA
jgi:hypothetical protein